MGMRPQMKPSSSLILLRLRLWATRPSILRRPQVHMVRGPLRHRASRRAPARTRCKPSKSAVWRRGAGRQFQHRVPDGEQGVDHHHDQLYAEPLGIWAGRDLHCDSCGRFSWGGCPDWHGELPGRQHYVGVQRRPQRVRSGDVYYVLSSAGHSHRHRRLQRRHRFPDKQSHDRRGPNSRGGCDHDRGDPTDHKRAGVRRHRYLLQSGSNLHSDRHVH